MADHTLPLSPGEPEDAEVRKHILFHVTIRNLEKKTTSDVQKLEKGYKTYSSLWIGQIDLNYFIQQNVLNTSYVTITVLGTVHSPVNKMEELLWMGRFCLTQQGLTDGQCGQFDFRQAPLADF